MQAKNASAIFVVAIIFIFFATIAASAQVIEESLRIPGITEETERHFEITNSKYLNIALDSTEEISVRIESAPEMIVINTEQSDGAQITQISISNIPPNTLFHKYEDDYHNYVPLTSDENGVVSFEQDISQSHLIFIQPRKSTKFIKDNTTGGDCASIGNWNAETKTCILNQDTNETIQIDNNNITLDGNGHKIQGNNTGFGVYARGNNNIIKNITVSNFLRGIYMRQSGSVISSMATRNHYGIYVEGNGNSGITILNSSVSANALYGIGLFRTKNNTISNNTVGPGNWVGIMQVLSDYSVYENNDFFKNQTGFVLLGNYNTLRGSTMRENTKANFYLKSEDMETNDIGLDNLIDGRPIYYEKNVSNKIYNQKTDMGSFYCANCENIKLENVVLPEKQAQIFFWRVNNSSIEGLTSEDKSTSIQLAYSSGNTIIKSTFDYVTIFNSSNGNRLYASNIIDPMDKTAVYFSSFDNLFHLSLPTGGNYWANNATRCRDNNGDGFCDSPYSFEGGQDYYPLVKEVDLSTPKCCSSVMFLPGHQASRLYRKNFDEEEDQLWEPTNHNEDVKQLYLNTDGGSVNSGIYTREVVDEVYGLADNVYKKFMNSMNQFVTESAINEWKPIPYDWRLSFEKIIDEGVDLKNGQHMNIIDEVKRMAATSKTGKVTLVGHSNGGILGKVIINKLKESGNEKLIDRLIMVATPQLGTPKAIVALLHGDEANLLHGLILNKETGRGFTENMISAYNLLPSKKYFEIVHSLVVEFDDDVKEIYNFRSLYGDNIDNWGEFKKFLTGDDGARSDPESGDTDSPNVLRKALLDKAGATHNKLDDWQAPEGTEVIQIAGWGLDTIRGIKYDDCDFIFCPDKLSNLDRSMLMTMDGDETVVVPSAVEMDGDAERYYLNLTRYNRLVNLKVDREHADILEIESLQNFIKNIIRGDKTLTEYLSMEKPEVKAEDKRLRFRLHSPVLIDLYDEDGRHTGLVQDNDSALRLYEEQVPNSYYTEFGETKYAGAGDSPINVVLTGEDLGTFTFEIDQVAGDTVAQNTTFANIPVMKDMQATLSVSETVSEMKIDVDGDNQIDATFRPGEKIKKENLLGIFEKIVNSLNVDATFRDRLINKIDNAKKQMKKGHNISANAMLENVKQQIEKFSDEKTPEKFRISRDEAEKLIEIVDRIQLVE